MAQMCIVSQTMLIFLYFKPHTMVIIHLDQALEHGSFKHYVMRYFKTEVYDKIYYSKTQNHGLASRLLSLSVFIYKVETSGDEEDLNSILTRTSRKVALVKRSNVPSDPELHHKRQIPLKQDTLIRYRFHILFAVIFSLMIMSLFMH